MENEIKTETEWEKKWRTSTKRKTQLTHYLQLLTMMGGMGVVWDDEKECSYCCFWELYVDDAILFFSGKKQFSLIAHLDDVILDDENMKITVKGKRTDIENRPEEEHEFDIYIRPHLTQID